MNHLQELQKRLEQEPCESFPLAVAQLGSIWFTVIGILSGYLKEFTQEQLIKERAAVINAAVNLVDGMLDRIDNLDPTTKDKILEWWRGTVDKMIDLVVYSLG